jgi:hypothetical protein
MDKMTKYRELVKRLLTAHLEICNRQPRPGVERLLITDDAQGNYMWMSLGWTPEERVDNVTVFVRVREGKIWIEEDWTEDGIATELLEAGVPKEDIVLAFHEPEMRQYTEFAVA